MYRLNLPTTTAEDAYDIAVSSILRSETKKTAFNDIKQDVLLICRHFDTLAAGSALSGLVVGDFQVPRLASTYSMANLYKSHFAPANKEGRKILDAIKNMVLNGLCPYCSEGLIYEIDHYLPKSIFPGVAVHPSNLVPSCRDCNHNKKAYAPGVDGVALFHPYFDADIEPEWLDAEVVKSESGGPVCYFRVNDSVLGTDLRARYDRHLDILELRTRYQLAAQQQLGDIDTKARIGGYAYIKDLMDTVDGSKKSPWLPVLYRAMLKSDWYMNEYLSN